MAFILNANETYYVADPCYLLTDNEYELHVNDMLGNMAVMYSKTTPEPTPFLWVRTFGGDIGASIVDIGSHSKELETRNKIIEAQTGSSIEYIPSEVHQRGLNITPPTDLIDFYDYKSFYTHQTYGKMFEASCSLYGTWELANDSGSIAILPESLVSSSEEASKCALKFKSSERCFLELGDICIEDARVTTYLTLNGTQVFGRF